MRTGAEDSWTVDGQVARRPGGHDDEEDTEYICGGKQLPVGREAEDVGLRLPGVDGIVHSQSAHDGMEKGSADG